MSHGITLWNANGELVYSSLNKTVQTLDMGEVTIANNTPYIVSFTPAESEPELWIGGQFFVDAVSTGNGQYSLMIRPFAGKFAKNAAGLYCQFTIQAVGIGTLPTTPGNILGLTHLPWTIPWVVFI